MTVTTTSANAETTNPFGAAVDIDGAEVAGILPPAKGGTGIANNAAATLTRVGNHALTITTSGTADLNVGAGGTLGTAAYTASTAYDAAGAAAAVTPTSLGLVIGTNVQAYDADLTTWAGVTPGANVGTFLATPTLANLNAAVSDADVAILGANAFADAQQSRGMLIDYGYTVVDKGTISSGTVTFDYTGGSAQTWTNGGAHTVATSNWPPTGNLGEMLLIGTNLGSAAITWPTITWIKPDGTTTTSIATYLAANTGRTALQTSGVDQMLLWSRDAGTTIYGKLI